MIWFRGTLVSDDIPAIGVRDRTFEHGLGLFETLRTWEGRPTLLDRHLARMRSSARELGVPLDESAMPTAEDVRGLVAAAGREGDALVRITLSGGDSPEGGSAIWMRTAPLPPPAAVEGARLGTSAPARQDPLVAHKSLNYWSYRLLAERARSEGCDEALLIDPDGCVLEGARTSVFFASRGALRTPPCDGRILPGIMRALVVERARALGIDVVEAPLEPPGRGPHPQEVFLTNAVRGIVPVGRWGEARFPAPGPTTRHLWDDVSEWLRRGGES